MEWTFTSDVPTGALVEALAEDRDFAGEVAGHIDTDDLMRYLDYDEIASHVDMYQLTNEIDLGDLSEHLDVQDIAEYIDLSKLAREVLDTGDFPNASEDVTRLREEVEQLRTQFDRLLGLFDWALEHTRKGVVLIDGNVDMTVDGGVSTAVDKGFPDGVGTVYDHHAQPVDKWTDSPNYL